MLRGTILGAVLITRMLFIPPLRAQTASSQEAAVSVESSPSQAALSRADDAESQGDLQRAHDAYRQAIELARQEKDSQTLARALLKYAAVCELAAKADGNVCNDGETASSYREVIERGDFAQRLLASNNLSVFFLERGDAKQAEALFEKIDFTRLSAAQYYVYFYNRGRALEAIGKTDLALSNYRQAIRRQPHFRPAIEASFRILWNTHPAPVKDAAELAFEITINRTPYGRRLDDRRTDDDSVLSQQSYLQFLVPLLHTSLTLWSKDPESQRLLVALVDCYAGLSLTPPVFEADEQPTLGPLKDGPLAPAIRQIELAFSGSFQPAFWSEGPVPPIADAWAEDDWKTKPYSSLLRRIGDFYRMKGELDKALACYSVAWSLNKRDSEPALYAAQILLQRFQQGSDVSELLDFFVTVLSEGKARTYSGLNSEDALRLHTILGTILAGEHKWGPRDDPRSAVFQFEQASEADKTAAFLARYPSSGLYQQLGDAYRHLDETKMAWSNISRAMNSYEKDARPEKAQDMRALAKSIIPSRDPGNAYASLRPIMKEAGEKPLLGFEGGLKDYKKGPALKSEFGLCQNPEVTPLDKEKIEMEPLHLTADLANKSSFYLVKLCVHIIAEPGEDFEEVNLSPTYKDTGITTINLFPSIEWKSAFHQGTKEKVFLLPSLDFLPESKVAKRKDDRSTAIFNFSYEWTYPVVQSSGEQGHFSEWRFKKKHDLAGELPLYVLLLVPKSTLQTTITMEAAFRVRVAHSESFEYRALESSPVIFVDLPSL